MAYRPVNILAGQTQPEHRQYPHIERLLERIHDLLTLSITY